MKPSNTKQKNPLLSVVMAAYNAEKTIGETLTRLLKEQTFSDFEVIIVNDASTDKTAAVVAKFQEEFPNIHLISPEKNVGPFKARIIGADAATGSYIHFIDADDYLSSDFYRSMLKKAVSSGADMVLGSIVLDFKNTGQIKCYPLINDLPFDTLDGADIFGGFMSQSGFNFLYHMNSTKVYSAKLWKKARPHFDKITEHLIMADDVAMNVPLWFFAKKLETVRSATLFYVKDDNDSATSTYKVSYSKFEKNIHDLLLVFNFFEDFLNNQKVYEKYEPYFENWKRTFVRIYEQNISLSRLPDNEKVSLRHILYDIAPFNDEEYWLDTPLFAISTPWRGGLDEVKARISNNDSSLVIFDFGTLFLSRQLPNGKFDYSLRKTGVELYELAEYLDKDIRFKNFPVSFDMEPYTSVFKQHQEASTADLHAASIDITLPLPIKIFTERLLETHMGHTYDGLIPGTAKTITETIANHYFDNPFIDIVGDAIFYGKPTLLGYYAIGINSLTENNVNLKNRNPLSESLISLAKRSDGALLAPYDEYFYKAVQYGSSCFIKDVDGLFSRSSISEIETCAVTIVNIAARPYAHADKQLLLPLANQRFNFIQPGLLEDRLARKNKIIKTAVYLLVDKGILISEAKRSVDAKTRQQPLINNALKSSYKKARSIKRKLSG